MSILTPLYKAKNLSVDIGKRVLFTSFDDQKRTPLIGEEAKDKADIFDYVHTYYRNELNSILRAFTEVRSHKQALPIVTDIYQEGIQIQYIPADVVLDDAMSNPSPATIEEVSKQTDNTVDNKTNNQVCSEVEKSAKQRSDIKGVENKGDKENRQQPEANQQAKEMPIDVIRQHPFSQSVFVPFRIQEASIEERFYYLYYEALIRLGKTADVKPSKATRYYFNVTNSEYVTPNMLRLHLSSEVPLPTDDPGFAYRFILTTLNKKSDKQDIEHDRFSLRKLPTHLWQHVQPKVQQLPFGDRFVGIIKKQSTIIAFEVLKRLPEAQREKLEAKATGLSEGRYYTLRQIHKPHLSKEDNAHIGEVDIYIHEGSPGSDWAKSLKAGDTIYADNDYEETIKNITIGQPLFVCDETSMPTVAAMLERWQIDTTPIVVAICNDKVDFAYMQQVTLADSLQDTLDIHYINTSTTDDLSQTVIDHLKSLDTKIDCAWGAIGKADFKPIKAYLREERGLTGKMNRLRAYWR